MHRDKLIQSAIRLFREKGYAASGLSEILKLSGAPKGSLYYYFPGGKEELAAAALEGAGTVVAKTLRTLAADADTPAAFVSAYCKLLAGWMEASNFRAGCPITTTILETVPQNPRLATLARQVFASWQGIIASVYVDGGMDEESAHQQAGFVIAAIEGALIQSRVEASALPIERVCRRLTGPGNTCYR